MIFTEQERDVALKLFSRVAEATADPAGGVTRESYGPGETTAWDIVAEVARDLNLVVSCDRAGNLLLSIEAEHAMNQGTRVTAIGSHLDSVPCGGNFDGLAGVVAALLILAKARDRGSRRPFVGVGFRGEESAWYGAPHLGARAMLGKLSNADLCLAHRARPNHTFFDALNGIRAQTWMIARGEPSLDAQSIAEYWELHIEQGPILQTKKLPIGIVTAIRGHARALDARVLGQAGHSGATPMHLRRDAVSRFARLAVEMEHRCVDMIGEGYDLVCTVGVVGTCPARHSATSIADEVTFSLDARSSTEAALHNFMEFVRAYGEGYLELGEVRTAKPCFLDMSLVQRAIGAAAKLGAAHHVMPSGAGHDASVFTEAGVPSGMVFVRNQGGSHNPHERMEIDDFMLGVEVLWAAVNS